MVRFLRDWRAWGYVLFLGISRVFIKFLALFVVPFLDGRQRKNHPLFGVRDTNDLSYYNIAIRNSAHNYTNRQAVLYNTWANTEDHTLEREKGLQWRYRRSLGGKYVSFRITWGEPRPKKGKREFYIGWTMNTGGWMRCAFFQFRPF